MQRYSISTLHTDLHVRACVICNGQPVILYEPPSGPFGWHFQIYCGDCADETGSCNTNTVLLYGIRSWNAEQDSKES